MPVCIAPRALIGEYLNWKLIALAMNRAKGNAPVPITGAKGNASTTSIKCLANPCLGLLAKVMARASSTAFSAILVSIPLPLAKCSVRSSTP